MLKAAINSKVSFAVNHGGYLERNVTYTAQKIKFSIQDFFSKCDKIRRKLWIWSHLPKKSLMERLIFWAVVYLRSHR